MSTTYLKVSESDHHTRLDVFLTEHTDSDFSRSFIKKLIVQSHVKVNEEVVKPNYLVCQGDDVAITIPTNFAMPSYAEPEDIPLNIFYENERFLVVHKPIGMLVHPASGRHSGTLVNALRHHQIQLSDFNSDQLRPGIVHRLDEDTSGLMIIAKDNITHTKLAKQFQKRLVRKRYVAVVNGYVDFDEGVIDAPIGQHPKHRDKKAVRFDESARESKTVYKVLNRANGVTLIALFPRTGRTHQLRVHMKYLGHPILGDSKYGKRSSFSRLALHAQAIGFRHPDTKKWVEFYSRIPQEFLAALKA